MALPAFLREIKQEELPASGRQMRALLGLVRSYSALDGKRYRIRFPREDEEESVSDPRQPIIEREENPIDEPEIFFPVSVPWAHGTTLHGKVRCAEVRLGKPNVDRLRQRRQAIADELEERQEDFEPERPPLVVEVDGTCEWVTFVLTEAPEDTDLERLEEFPSIEVILDGETGLAWLQRPFFDEELDLFEEKSWPVVLGQDYLETALITEDRVLELRDFKILP